MNRCPHGGRLLGPGRVFGGTLALLRRGGRRLGRCDRVRGGIYPVERREVLTRTEDRKWHTRAKARPEPLPRESADAIRPGLENTPRARGSAWASLGLDAPDAGVVGVGEERRCRAAPWLTACSSSTSHALGLTCPNTTPMRLDAGSIVGTRGRGRLGYGRPSGSIGAIFLSRARLVWESDRRVFSVETDTRQRRARTEGSRRGHAARKAARLPAPDRRVTRRRPPRDLRPPPTPRRRRPQPHPPHNDAQGDRRRRSRRHDHASRALRGSWGEAGGRGGVRPRGGDVRAGWQHPGLGTGSREDPRCR